MIANDHCMKQYIHQSEEKGYACCIAIAFINALIYYNKPFITSLDDSKWELLVDKYCCRDGSVIGKNRLALELGILQIPIEREEIKNNLPAKISSYTKVGFHASLVIEADDDVFTIVNYNGYKGDLIEKVPFSKIEFPRRGVPVDKHYHLKLMDPLYK